MNIYSTNPDDVGITVIGGTTGLGDMTQQDLEKKMEQIKQSFRANKTLIQDEFWNGKKSESINELREKNPSFQVGKG